MKKIKKKLPSRKTTLKKIKKITPKKKKKVVKFSKVVKKVKAVKISKKTEIKKKKNKKKDLSKFKRKKKEEILPIKLSKTPYNPIISPSYYSWESRATFNPAAVESNGKIHLLYRAVGDDDNSVLGYASTFDGFRIAERPTYAVYKRYFNYFDNLNPAISYFSGGGWSGGCEDPRLSLIDDILYMLYTAFDGWGSVRIALTSIKFDDFKKKKWHWKKPVLISAPGELNKNWVLFPEKIKGKFAILHGISDGVLVDYFNSLNELNGQRFIKSISHHDREEAIRKTGIRSVGPTPIKTDLGWLIFYHITENGQYKLKAMILDEKDPTKILYRSQNSILEPEEDYENNGHKWGVIYSCGAVVKEGEVFVYYGGSDKFVCVASISLKELLDDLKQNKEIKLIKKRKMNS